MKKSFKRASALLLAVLCVLSAFACCITAYASSDDTGIYDSLDDLSGKNIAVVTGTLFDTIAEANIDSPQLVYLQTEGDGILSLKNGRADGLVCDEPYAKYMLSSDDSLTLIDEPMDSQQLAIAFSKTDFGQKLCSEINVYIDKWSQDGTLDDMMAAWTDVNSEKPVIDTDSLSGENGTVKFSVNATNPPMDYIENNEIVGYEVDIMYRFCRAEGYALEISDSNFDSLIPGITSGKSDAAACSLAITDERKQNVLFSSPICNNRVLMIISKAHSAEGASESSTSFFASVASSFKKTFITESRWKMFISGIGLTLFITVASLIFGTLLGFALYMWYWSGSKAAAKVTVFFDWLMNRMPMVVLLMILFYVVFAKTDISGTAVAIIGFTLVFAGNVYGMLKGGVNAVDGGQMEAALALGYRPLRAFFKVVFPQAAVHFMPGYRSAIISLINSTAIVGYVAVQDLTKVSDIVRSRTYEAFFPLIATAVIYIILAELLILIVKTIEKFCMPGKKKKSKYLKGVKKDD